MAQSIQDSDVSLETVNGLWVRSNGDARSTTRAAYNATPSGAGNGIPSEGKKSEGKVEEGGDAQDETTGRACLGRCEQARQNK